MAQENAKKSGGIAELLVPFVAVTALGGGGGWFLGASSLASKEVAGAAVPLADAKEQEKGHGKEKATKEAHGKATPPETNAHGKGTGDKADHGEALQVKELPPIVANLAGGKTLIRLLTAIVLDPQEIKHADRLTPELMSDFTAFLNTLELRDIEGPDGLRRLQEELNERAHIRSEGLVHELIVESMVVQ